LDGKGVSVRKLQPVQLRPWVLPLIVVALVGPPIAGFALAGPMAGLALGAVAAATVVVIAARARYEEAIEVGASPGERYMLMVVAIDSIEDPGTAGAIAEIARAGAGATDAGPDRDPELMVVAPSLNTPVAHWLSDLRKARGDAQRRLAVSLGSLAAAGLDAQGQVGDTDPVQAVEDALHTFPAQELVFVGGRGHDTEIEEVRRRLDRPIRVLDAASGQPSGKQRP
jgi:hypothetical protein